MKRRDYLPEVEERSLTLLTYLAGELTYFVTLGNVPKTPLEISAANGLNYYFTKFIPLHAFNRLWSEDDVRIKVIEKGAYIPLLRKTAQIWEEIFNQETEIASPKYVYNQQLCLSKYCYQDIFYSLINNKNPGRIKKPFSGNVVDEIKEIAKRLLKEMQIQSVAMFPKSDYSFIHILDDTRKVYNPKPEEYHHNPIPMDRPSLYIPWLDVTMPNHSLYRRIYTPIQGKNSVDQSVLEYIVRLSDFYNLPRKESKRFGRRIIQNGVILAALWDMPLSRVKSSPDEVFQEHYHLYNEYFQATVPVGDLGSGRKYGFVNNPIGYRNSEFFLSSANNWYAPDAYLVNYAYPNQLRKLPRGTRRLLRDEKLDMVSSKKDLMYWEAREKIARENEAYGIPTRYTDEYLKLYQETGDEQWYVINEVLLAKAGKHGCTDIQGLEMYWDTLIHPMVFIEYINPILIERTGTYFIGGGALEIPYITPKYDLYAFLDTIKHKPYIDFPCLKRGFVYGGNKLYRVKPNILDPDWTKLFLFKDLVEVFNPENFKLTEGKKYYEYQKSV